MPPISLDRQYQTRDGRKVRIYAVDGAAPFVVHGAILTMAGWTRDTWGESGKYNVHGLPDSRHDCDLIAIPKPIQVNGTIDIGRDPDGKIWTSCVYSHRPTEVRHREVIARIPITLICNEGDGL